MKRKIILVVIILVFVLSVFYGIYRIKFTSMRGLPKGELYYESTSPQGTYTIRLYETNPPLSAGGTRGEVTDNETQKKQNIYWEYNRNLSIGSIARREVIVWESDNIVIIYGTRLNLPNDKYDWRYDR